MSMATSGIDKARADAQDLHKRVLEATAKDQAAMKADFVSVAADAQQLVDSLKTTAAIEQPDARAYLNDAAAVLQDAANHAKDAATAATPELNVAKSRVIAEVTNGVQSVSRAVAVKRSAQNSTQV